MIWSIAQAASPVRNSDPVVKRPRTCGHDGFGGAEDGDITAESSHAGHRHPKDFGPVTGPPEN
jgi:hypothetical protein